MDFRSLEVSAKTSTEAFAAGFLSEVLSSVNKHISESDWRKGRYTIARNDKRTVISSVGDVTFDCTYFRNSKTGSYSYLVEELLGLSKTKDLLRRYLTYKNVICGMIQKNKSKSGAEILKYKSQYRLTGCGNNDRMQYTGG